MRNSGMIRIIAGPTKQQLEEASETGKSLRVEITTGPQITCYILNIEKMDEICQNPSLFWLEGKWRRCSKNNRLMPQGTFCACYEPGAKQGQLRKTKIIDIQRQ